MNISQTIIGVYSEKPQELLKFYREVVGLAPNPDMGEDALMAGQTPFFVDGHSDLHGQASEPARQIVSFFVDDVVAERERLEQAGVAFIRKEGTEYWGGVISTFLDPDGNYCQIIQFKPELSQQPS